MTGEWMCGLCLKYERAVSVINMTSASTLGCNTVYMCECGRLHVWCVRV